MIISSSITIGQITFILRVAIQILKYAGLAVIGVLILGTAPRVASISTHDTLNRIVGASTSTRSTVKWLFSRLRGNKTGVTPSMDLILILFLSVSYAIFISLSDIGFLGFHACSVPGPNTAGSPASINSTNDATALINASVVNGTDLSKVKAYRCDSSSPVRFDTQVLQNCTAWHNGTYADEHLFSSLNFTDSDVLMPRELSHFSYPRESIFDLNTFYVGPTTARVTSPIVERGVAIEPHATGVRLIVGVPQLSPNTKVSIAKTMAVEVDVGCMSLGAFGSRTVWDVGGSEYFQTNGTWREYTGPSYLEDVLTRTVDDIRAYLQPLFNPTTLDSKGYLSNNDTNIIFTPVANVNRHRLPKLNSSSFVSVDSEFMGNCTERLQRQLGIPVGGQDVGSMCSLLGIGGTHSVDGVPLQGYRRMVCAATTQVNMVAATVQVDAVRNISLNLTRLPSDLTYVFADYWDPLTVGNATEYNKFTPYERYTLSDNPNSPTTHFIRHRLLGLSDDQSGQGTAGNAISAVGDTLLASSSFFSASRYSGLILLDEGYNYVNISSAQLAKWVGQVGGSYFVGSFGYNGWAALQTTPLAVLSTGGRLGSCYTPYYALGFLPLVLAATVLMCWAFLLLIKGSWSGNGAVKAAYGGVRPHTAVMCPEAPPKDTLLAWESSPQPRLQVISKGYPLTGDENATALKYLKSTPSNP